MIVHHETVRWQDIDCHGVLNNAVYLTLFEQSRLAYFSQLDAMLDGDRFPFLLGETKVRFERPARCGATLAIRARVTRLGTKSFDMDYVVSDGDDEIARGDATLVWFDGERSVAIPDEVKTRIREREGL